MGRAWDRALPPVDVWREVLRVLKPGAFAFVMCIPRQDCLARMVVSLEDAGFNVSFSPIFHVFASGFPKAGNISKMVDKRLGAERKFLGLKDKRYLSPATEISGAPMGNLDPRPNSVINYTKAGQITAPATPQAQALDGSYGGFQPKPAVEVILVAMKPLSEKTYVDQALRNGKGVTWLDEGRIPYEGQDRLRHNEPSAGKEYAGKLFARKKARIIGTNKGRFPSHLLVSDDALNDGRVYDTHKGQGQGNEKGTSIFGAGTGEFNKGRVYSNGNSGSFSRYFSLDTWFAKKLAELPKGVQRTFPFLIVPKASKAEKNKGCEGLEKELGHNRFDKCKKCGGYILQNPDRPSACKCDKPEREHNRVKGNFHSTVKPLKLISYLLVLGSRPGDVVLDPFIGSGTTAIAARMLHRRYIGYETDPDYCRIAEARLSAVQERLI